jgi:PadR family transcriptional regulator AphA
VAQERRPDKHLYAITPAGEEALRGWLEVAEGDLSESRGLLLKLFFGGHAHSETLKAQVLVRKQLAEAKLAELGEIERGIDREEDFFQYLTLLHGLDVTRATIAWTERVLKLLDREPARARV